MEKANRRIPVIDDRPMTPERLEAMHRKWLMRLDDTAPWEEDTSDDFVVRKMNRGSRQYVHLRSMAQA